MKVYSYSRITKEFENEGEAFIEPLGGTALCPAHATFIKPKQPKDGYKMIFKDDKWVEAIDHRGPVYDTESGTERPWKELGPLPNNMTLKVPRPYDRWDEEKKEWAGHNEFLKQQFKHESSYEFKRAKAYPPILNQLDALYWDKINKTNNWVESITKVKEKYPKPENKNV
jgi:hypothetical protein